ncbi:transport and Golgi organization protein 1 isoform X2 [Orussus abietinus]|uniref:transport and Golgi organization protein 1 isoform X2 n=1 Tax=Orussus abietinus TaxID=222816 RepID=UPI0006269F26|nr:transport and Golgi organization protein 1 isoform X2 [Orussus abietinus]
MTKMVQSITFLYVAVCALIATTSLCSAAISDKRLCYDPNCSVPVSLARTIIRYNSRYAGILGFNINQEVEVFSKSAGNRMDLWGVKIRNKRGYAPYKFLREYKVFHHNLTYEVSTEEAKEPIDESTPHKQPNGKKSLDEKRSDSISVDKDKSGQATTLNIEDISPSYEVVDGTTIYYTSDELSDQPSYSTKIVENVRSNEQPILTVLPLMITDDIVTLASPEPEKESTASKETTVPGIANMPSLQVPSDNSEQKLSDVEKDLHSEKSESKSLEQPASLHQSVDSSAPADSIEKKETEPVNDDIVTDNTKEEKKGENDNLKQNEAKEGAFSQQCAETEFSTKENGVEIGEEVNVDSNVNVSLPLEATEASTVCDNCTTEKLHVEEASPNFDEKVNREASAVKLKGIDSSSNTVPSVSVPVDAKPDEVVQDVISSSEDNIAPIEETIKEIPDESKTDGNTHVSLNEDTNKDEQMTEQNGETIEEKPILPKDDVIVDNSQDKVPDYVTNDVTPEKDITVRENQDTSVDNARNGDITTDKNEDTVVISVKEDDSLADKIQNTTAEVLTDSVIDTERVNDNDVQPQVDSSIDRGNHSYVKLNDSLPDVPIELNTQDSQETLHTNLKDENEATGSDHPNILMQHIASFNQFFSNRNLLNVEEVRQPDNQVSQTDAEKSTEIDQPVTEVSPQYEEVTNEVVITEHVPINTTLDEDVDTSNTETEYQVAEIGECSADFNCPKDTESQVKDVNEETEYKPSEPEESAIIHAATSGRSYWETLTYVGITAFTTLLFSLGYYYIENMRRDNQLIARINQLEKELLVSVKECIVLDENLKSTKSKLNSIEDESFGSNEMVISLKSDLEASQTAKAELEEQIVVLEKELESATEAGLELERMLREILSTNNEDNPLAQTVEDLQSRLNAQQATNESLINKLNLKTQENEALSSELASANEKWQQLEVEVSYLREELKTLKNETQRALTDKIEELESKIAEMSAEKVNIRKQLKNKEMEVKDLLDLVNQISSNSLDLDKIYNVSRIKAEASQILEERDELKIKLSEVEGAHQLLEEHMNLVREEITSLSEQCRLAEKEKREAETRLEVLSKFFKEKEAERQKEEAVWLQKQGEVTSTVERIQMMQDELHNYKQQVEMLKREIFDQEREYKNQISILETKSHEQWVVARQNERRLEESKAEASQLRHRLTLVEKNINEAEPEAKLHRRKRFSKVRQFWSTMEGNNAK